jgi:pimeloyl-ACP methyl ester carboxylesterase
VCCQFGYPTLLALVLAGLVTGGCGQVLRVHEQVSQLEELAVIDGHISADRSEAGDLVVAVLTRRGPGRFRREDWSMPNDDGTFQFRVRPGSYFLIGFLDRNGNRELDENEAATFSGETEPQVLRVTPGQHFTAPSLELGRMLTFAEDTVLEYRNRAWRGNIGRSVALDDEMFSRGYYQLGIWRPLDFMQRVGSGLFLLHRYDPKRPMVLLVHGQGGGPRDWSTLAPALRRNGMQVLIAYYPSGIGLDLVQDWIAGSILELRNRWGLDSLHVIGHSMGGLIARGLVATLNERQRGLLVRSLTTINSPMGGLQSARTGVARAPIVIPSWRSLAAGSDYLDHLSRWTPPADLPYVLVFTYRTGVSGDGVVPLSSQIPLWVQAQATVLRGFESEHGLALHDSRVVEFITKRLRDIESGEEPAISRVEPKGSASRKSD